MNLSTVSVNTVRLILVCNICRSCRYFLRKRVCPVLRVMFSVCLFFSSSIFRFIWLVCLQLRLPFLLPYSVVYFVCSIKTYWVYWLFRNKFLNCCFVSVWIYIYIFKCAQHSVCVLYVYYMHIKWKYIHSKSFSHTWYELNGIWTECARWVLLGRTQFAEYACVVHLALQLILLLVSVPVIEMERIEIEIPIEWTINRIQWASHYTHTHTHLLTHCPFMSMYFIQCYCRETL